MTCFHNMIPAASDEYRNICLREPFGPMRIPFECHRHNVEHAFVISVWKPFRGPEEVHRRLCCPTLLRYVHIVLRRGLYAAFAGLDLNKMQAFRAERYDVYLKVTAAPVPFKYGVPHVPEHVACNVFSQLS